MLFTKHGTTRTRYVHIIIWHINELIVDIATPKVNTNKILFFSVADSKRFLQNLLKNK